MGNLCTGPSSTERQRKREARRGGSGSTTGFSPTEDPHTVQDGTGPDVLPGDGATRTFGLSSSSAQNQQQRSRENSYGGITPNGVSGGRGSPAAPDDVDLQEKLYSERERERQQQLQEEQEQQRQQTRLDHSRRSDRSNTRSGEDEYDGDHQQLHSSSDPPLNRSHRRESSRDRASAGAGAQHEGSRGDGGVPSGDEQRSERGAEHRERRHRSERRDGESGRRKSKRSSGSGGDKADGSSSKSSKKEGEAGEQRSNSTRSSRKGSSRRSSGDQSGRRPRSERSEEEIAKRKARRERDKAARANGKPESEEGKRERQERKERREQKKAKEAAAAAAASGGAALSEAAGGGGGRGSGTTASEPAASFQGSSESKREHKKSRRKAEAAAAAASAAGGVGSAEGDGQLQKVNDEERLGLAGSGGAGAGEGVAVDAAQANGHNKKKGSSSFRKMYDSITGGFSGSGAQQNAGSGGNAAGGGGGGGDGGSGGGGGGGTSSSGKTRSSRERSSSRGSQLVTSVTSRDVREKYEIERSQLGHGHYGVVRRCWDKETREGYAIKTIKKSKVSRIESLRREIEILRCVDHPCIIKLYDVYEDDRFIHLVTELCKGGELFDRIIQKTESEEGHYSEKDAKVVVASILSGIEYCHNEHNICHRDLKPENFLFKRPDSDTEIKIIDFGLSRFEDMASAMTTRVGTPYYIAPEVLSRKYDKACDLWSIGVITYILLAGYPPFYGESDQEIFASVRHGYFDFPSPEWDNISTEAKDFITQLLQKDPAARMTATQSIAHRWFARGDGDDADAGDDSKKGQINMQVSMQRINHRLRRFVGMSKLKKVALNVIAQQLTEAEIGHLREVFERLDADGKGVISTNELEQVVQQEGLDNLQDDVVRLLQGIDIDGSNSLNYREFLAATMERNIFIREENIRCAFDYFDLDGNSEITLSNLVKIFGAEEHAREIMNDVNLSGEGVINYDEFKSMMMEMPLDGRDPMTPRTPRTPRFLN